MKLLDGFKRSRENKRKLALTKAMDDLILFFISTNLPAGFHARKCYLGDEKDGVLVSVPKSAKIIAYDIAPTEKELSELSDDEKSYILDTIVMPMLEDMSKNSLELHKSIELKLKELRST